MMEMGASLAFKESTSFAWRFKESTAFACNTRDGAHELPALWFLWLCFKETNHATLSKKQKPQLGFKETTEKPTGLVVVSKKPKKKPQLNLVLKKPQKNHWLGCGFKETKKETTEKPLACGFKETKKETTASMISKIRSYQTYL